MRRLAFVWENFGFMHNDRLDAVARAVGAEGEVIGIELFSKSGEYYGWENKTSKLFRKITLFEGSRENPPSGFLLGFSLAKACLKVRAKTIFMCGHGLKGIFLSAILLRLIGRRLIVLTVSKFDDRPRSVFKEFLKSIYYAPYHGAIVPSYRSVDYMRFLGFRNRPIKLYYDNQSLTRIRQAAGSPPAPKGVPHADRVFVSVARLVPKKNHRMLLFAYALYVKRVKSPRPLILCGSGPLEDELRAFASELGISNFVEFKGWQNENQIARYLAKGLALILCSTEEQFGIAVVEALAMGVPPIVSENVGARDIYVRSGVNGFLVESDNPEGLALAMTRLAENEALWARMAKSACQKADDEADVSLFAQSVLSFS